MFLCVVFFALCSLQFCLRDCRLLLTRLGILFSFSLALLQLPLVKFNRCWSFPVFIDRLSQHADAIFSRVTSIDPCDLICDNDSSPLLQQCGCRFVIVAFRQHAVENLFVFRSNRRWFVCVC